MTDYQKAMIELMKKLIVTIDELNESLNDIKNAIQK
jgi:hypothetical protein